MKRFITILAAMAVIFSFSACDKDDNRDTDTEIILPGENNNSNNNGGGSTEDPGTEDPGTEDPGTDNTGNSSYNNTFTYGYAGYCGQYYEDQPANTTNWYIELADDNYDLDYYEGTGYNIVFDLFAAGTSSTSIPSGRYTVEAFDESMFSAGSLMYGYIAEDEEYGEYPGGTWLYEGNDGIAGATSGWVEISKSGSNYTIKYELQDEEWEITFKGSFSGALTLYDATEEYSSYSQAKSQRRATARKSAPVLKLKVRR